MTEKEYSGVRQTVDFSERMGSKVCHICRREMECVKNGGGDVIEDSQNNIHTVTTRTNRGAGICPEHGVSHTLVSVPVMERGNCDCGKENCPTCE